MARFLFHTFPDKVTVYFVYGAAILIALYLLARAVGFPWLTALAAGFLFDVFGLPGLVGRLSQYGSNFHANPYWAQDGVACFLMIATFWALGARKLRSPTTWALIVVPALLVASTYLAWWELRFLVQGRTTDAVVDRVTAIERHRTFGDSYLEVRYSFQDEQTKRFRTERDELPLSWPRPGSKVRIEYVPELPGGSRVEGHRHVWFTILFVVCLIGSGVYVGLLLREARRAVSEEEAFEARRRRRHEA